MKCIMCRTTFRSALGRNMRQELRVCKNQALHTYYKEGPAFPKRKPVALTNLLFSISHFIYILHQPTPSHFAHLTSYGQPIFLFVPITSCLIFQFVLDMSSGRFQVRGIVI